MPHSAASAERSATDASPAGCVAGMARINRPSLTQPCQVHVMHPLAVHKEPAATWSELTSSTESRAPRLPRHCIIVEPLANEPQHNIMSTATS